MNRRPEEDDDDFSDGSDDFRDRFGGSPGRGDEDEFDYDAPSPAAHASAGRGMVGSLSKSQTVKNQPFDEAVDVSDDGTDEASSPDVSPVSKRGPGGRHLEDRGDSPPQSGLSDSHADYDDGESADMSHVSYAQQSLASQSQQSQQQQQQQQMQHQGRASSSVSSASSRSSQQQQQQQPQHQLQMQQQQQQMRSSLDDSGSGDQSYESPDMGEESGSLMSPAGGNVSDEMKQLFAFIGAYKPHTLDLDTKLKPFVPEFIPAVGDIDAFIKIPRPDKRPDAVGLSVLDEPASNQSDPTVLDLQLRSTSKASVLQPAAVRSVEQADKNPKLITNWINSISDLHRSKPPPTVNYSKQMPDIDSLMQVWPQEFEELLQSAEMPSADLDLDTTEYAKLICSLLDIPVYGNVIESLHCLFTLYSDVKITQQFQENQQL